MSEIDLEKLKEVPAPAPRPEARAAAVAAALQAFGKDDVSLPVQPKEAARVVRLTRTSQETWRFSMLARSRKALAASLAVLAIGVPAAIMVHQSARQSGARFGLVDGGSGQRTDVAEAPQLTAPAVLRLERPEPAQELARDRARAELERQQQEQAALSEARRQAELRRLQSAEMVRRQEEARTAVLPAAREKRELDAVLRSRLGAQAPAPQARAVVGTGQNVFHGGRDLSSQPHPDQGRDRFASAEANTVKSVATDPVSTFSIDVDTASYAFIRRSLNAGRLPAHEAVRIEEMINYFPYAYPGADGAATPFRPTVTVLPSPWNAANRLLHIAIKGYDLKSAERPRANLVLLVDVSGSMAPADRLPLLKNAFRMLLDNLQPDDTVAIVTYASGSDVRLKPTKVSDRYAIITAIESLTAGGSTHGAAGIQDAYRIAEAGFDKAAVNRVILATDGDWNVGITSHEELKRFIEARRKTGIYLSVLGVGMGNHNDQLMQALAQNGNGIAAYIDTLSEARKVLVDEATSSLFPIAKDVKIQVEFNPARVSEYRLIGYETRALRREDFNNDKVDAGDVGSGHAVTAIYEITPVGAPGFVDGPRYRSEPVKAATQEGQEGRGQARAPDPAARALEAEYAFLKLRYKLPSEEESRLLSVPVTAAHEVRSIEEASTEVRFSVAVAAFGELLRGLPHTRSFGFDEVIRLANGAKGEDPFGYRAEMINLARLAKSARP